MSDNLTRDQMLVEKLIDDAWDVSAKWSIVRATGGAIGGCGLPDAIDILSLVLDDMEPDENDES